jgi:CTP:molybdopterin cytidylyltransferase MocA
MIPALVLAAGRSSRMGRAKATLPLDGGDSFLTRIVRTFLDAGVDDVVVVVGHEADAIVSAFASSGLPARFAVNREYDRGQWSSLVTGLGVVDRPGVLAVLVTLVDVPLVAADTVRAVVDCYRRTRAPVVRPTSGARHGHPLLIGRSLFAEIRAADPTAGAKPIIRASIGRRSAVVRAAARVVWGGFAGGLKAGEIKVLVARLTPHFRFGIPFCDEPGPDARRYVMDRAPLESVDAHTVELVFRRRDRDSDSQLPTHVAARYTMQAFSTVVASNSKPGTHS